MKFVYIGVLKNDKRPAVELTCERDLSPYNFIQKPGVVEFTTFFAIVVAQRTGPAESKCVKHFDSAGTGYVFYSCGSTEGICGIVITDDEYPSHIAENVVGKVVKEFSSKYPRTAYASSTKLSFPELKTYIQKYQDPQQADSIMKIQKVQKEIDQTKMIMYDTIESLLERGEKIEDLVAKSSELSAQSKMFYTQAKKQNSCCVVM